MEGGALVEHAVEPYLAAVTLYDALSDEKSKSRSVRLSMHCILRTEEARKNLVFFVLRNTDTGIFNREVELIVVHEYGDCDRTVILGVLDGIIDEIL